MIAPLKYVIQSSNLALDPRFDLSPISQRLFIAFPLYEVIPLPKHFLIFPSLNNPFKLQKVHLILHLQFAYLPLIIVD